MTPTPDVVVDGLRSLDGQIDGDAQEVVIVDNNSGDNSPDLIEQARARTTFVQVVDGDCEPADVPPSATRSMRGTTSSVISNGTPRSETPNSAAASP